MYESMRSLVDIAFYVVVAIVIIGAVFKMIKKKK